MPKTELVRARLNPWEADDLGVILEYIKQDAPPGVIINQTDAIAYAITMTAIQIRQEIAS